MKKTFIVLLCATISFAVSAQEPFWLDAGQREKKFPEGDYFTGFASFEVSNPLALNAVMQQAKNEAQADLSKKIRVRIASVTQNEMLAQNINGQYRERESFSNTSSATTDAEVVGIRIESYYDSKAKLAYAFSCVNRHELLTYYKSNIEVLLQQAENSLNIAVQLEQNGEKSKARIECEQVPGVLGKVYDAQSLLAAIDAANIESVQQERVGNVRSECAQILARLSQGICLFVESNENVFGQLRKTVGNKIKAQLANHGCSFVDDPSEADFKLRVDALARVSSEIDGIVFCYADVVVELYDTHKQRVVMSDELSQKGSSVTKEKAAAKALDNAVPQIVERLKNSIK